eukprot:5741357-Alexandrium_andersonii.AAC.1
MLTPTSREGSRTSRLPCSEAIGQPGEDIEPSHMLELVTNMAVDAEQRLGDAKSSLNTALRLSQWARDNFKIA